MRIKLLVALAILLLVSSAFALGLSIARTPEIAYSTGKEQAEFHFKLNYNNVSCGEGVPQAFSITLPKWYETPADSQISAYSVSADGNISEFASCPKSPNNPRSINCSRFQNGDNITDTNRFIMLLDLKTNAKEGNPARDEFWNAVVICDLSNPERQELTYSFEVKPPEIGWASPEDGSVLNGIAPLQVKEANGIPHKVVFRFRNNGKSLLEIADTNGADGWFIEWNTFKVEDGNYSVAAYACDHTLKCSETPAEAGFIVKNVVSKPVDNDPPELISRAPVGRIRTKQVIVSATFKDPLGIEEESISMQIDGFEVKSKYERATRTVSYAPKTDFKEGPHTVTVYAADTNSNKGVYNWDFFVTSGQDTQDESKNQKPIITFLGASDTTVNSGEEVYFESIFYDPDYDELVFTWDFGDGTTSEEQTPKHVFEIPLTQQSQTFEVTFTLSDGKSEASQGLEIEVLQPGYAPPEEATEQGIDDALYPYFEKEYFNLYIFTLPGLFAAGLLYLVVKRIVLGRFLAPREKQYKKNSVQETEKMKKKAKYAENKERGKKGREKGASEEIPGNTEKAAGPAKTIAGKMGKKEQAEVKRLVRMLGKHTSRYSREEMLKTILEEGYSDKVAEHAIETMYKK